jgi:hypothetical protein
VRRLQEPALRGAHLLAASGFALAQPLFDILGKNAEFFAVRGSTPSDIVLFALVVTFVPAAVLLGIELLVGLVSARAGLVLHYVFLASLAALFAVQALKRLGFDSTVVLIGGGILLGVGIALAVARTSLARTFMTVLAAAPIVFLCVFLFNSSVTDLIFPPDVEVRVAQVGASTPVVWLLFDEFPVISIMDENGEIDAKRYPNFARLAASSTWFKNTTTFSASTTVAVPSMLTGKIPGKRKLPVFQNFPRNLFTLLGKDYGMNVTESQTRLCPPQLCARATEDTTARLSGLYSDARIVYLHLLSPPALEDRLPAIDESWGEFGNEAAGSGDSLSGVTVDKPKTEGKTFYAGRVRDFNTFVDSLKPPVKGKPTLDFLHVLLPHGPWLYFPDGRSSAVATANAPGRNGELWWDDGLANQAHQRHFLQLAYADKLLGQFLDKLEQTGLWDEALVLVTADHGISFHGGDLRRAPTETNLAELAFTPLFIKFPGEEKGKVVERHVTIADILPTVADGLGIKVPWSIEGRSALGDSEPSDTVRVVTVSKPYEEALAQRDADLARQIALFGSGEWGPAFFGLGPYEGLLGENVSALTTTGGKVGTATVDKVGSRLLRDLPANARAVPSPLEATLADVAKGAQLALSVNGMIAAVAQTYQDATGPVRVSFLVPEDAFRTGENEVRVFAVNGPAANPILVSLQTSLS